VEQSAARPPSKARLNFMVEVEKRVKRGYKRRVLSARNGVFEGNRKSTWAETFIRGVQHVDEQYALASCGLWEPPAATESGINWQHW